MGAHKIEGEAPYDSHVFGAVANAVARQVVLELDIEEPVHAFDAPMAACRAGNALDVEGRRGDIETGINTATIGIFGARVDFEQGVHAGAAGRAWIAALRANQINSG